MKSRQIEAFRAVIEAGGVTHAAERLRISQPAVSKLVIELETAVGLTLFVRQKRRLVPTHEARLLYDEIDRVFLSIEHIAQYADDLRTLRTGQVRIACLPSLGLRVIPELIAGFVAGKPDAHISVDVRTSSEITEALLAKKADVGISLLKVEHPSILVEPLASVDAVCVLPPSHRLARRPKITPADLVGESFISLGHEDRAAQLISRTFDSCAVQRKIHLETNLSESACRLVAAGAGVSIVDPLTAAYFSSSQLIALPFRPRITFQIYLLFPAFRPRSKLLGEFVALLSARLRVAMDGRFDGT